MQGRHLLTEESRQQHSGESVDALAPTAVNGVPATADKDSQQGATLALAGQVDHLLEAKVPSHRRGWLLRRALAAADIVGLTAALFIAEWAVGAPNGAGTLSQSTEIAAFLVSLPVWIIVARAYGLYDQDEERTDHSAPDEFSGIFHMVTVCTAGAAALSFVTGATRPTTPKLVIFWAAAIICVVLARAAARALARRTSWYLQNTLILGAGDVGQTIAHKLLQHPEYGINLVGFVDDHPKERRDDLAHLTVIGGSSDLREIVRTPRHRARDRGLFRRFGRRHTPTSPNPERRGRPGRRRSTPLRTRFPRRRSAHGRGNPPRRTSQAEAFAVFSIPEARPSTSRSRRSRSSSWRRSS